ETAVCTDFDGDTYLCEQPTTAGALLLLAVTGLALGVSVGYLGWWQGRTGQTLGKRIVGLRVVHLHTMMPLGGGRGIGRWLGTIVSALPCYLGYLWPLWDDKNQAWHDMMVTSIVIKDPR
ncbi:MAG: RDD family protein, partial [Acidimicrobiia bacterium]|nr:RDD family protein [Acidimicrobiia bacterium]